MTIYKAATMRAAMLLSGAAAGLMPEAAKAADALAASQLQQCARQVSQLRQDSPVLTAQSEAIERERDAINRRTAELDAEDARIERDNLKAGLDLHQRRLDNQQRAKALNARLATLVAQIDALNALKADYDQRCSDRPYRRADLLALPAEQQAAMRAGLGDVQVPYIDRSGGDAGRY